MLLLLKVILPWKLNNKNGVAKVNNKLSEVCGVQQKLFNRNFIIDISVNMFAYIGNNFWFLLLCCVEKYMHTGHTHMSVTCFFTVLYSVQCTPPIYIICNWKKTLLITI